MAPSNRTTSTPPKLVVTLPSLHHSTLQWHPAMALRPLHESTQQWYPAMAPSDAITPTPPKLVPSPPTIAQWHPAMAPSNGTTSTPPKHTTMAPLQWHPAMAPHPLRQSWSSPSPPPTIAHDNGTLQWHHVHCTLQWHPGATSNPPKWFVALPPLGSKNPYSYRYLGKNTRTRTLKKKRHFLQGKSQHSFSKPHMYS